MRNTPNGETDTLVLVLECYVRANPTEVFSDLTVPERLPRWWGDRSKWWLTGAEVDLRPGGRFWVLWENTKGEADGMGGQLKEINLDQSFALSFAGSHAKDHIDEVTIRLDPQNTGTRVVLRHSGLAGRPEHYNKLRAGLGAYARLASPAVLTISQRRQRYSEGSKAANAQDLLRRPSNSRPLPCHGSTLFR